VPKTNSNSARSVVHATFSIERTYRASPAQVFKALTDPAAKAKWFGGGNGYTLLAREMNVRTGGREHVKGRWDSGVVMTEQGAFLDGYDDAGSREHGTHFLLDALGDSLK
jgi:uncharacterized protein YndB with AHSA1/START domain